MPAETCIIKTVANQEELYFTRGKICQIKSVHLSKKLLGKNNNLISLDEPYEVMRCLLKGHDITGIIDAGASDGRISKRLLRKFPTADAYAFEPNRLYFDSLQQYTKENPRFHPYFLALSDS